MSLGLLIYQFLSVDHIFFGHCMALFIQQALALFFSRAMNPKAT